MSSAPRFLSILLAGGLFLTACDGSNPVAPDPDPDSDPPAQTEEISGTISQDLTLTSGVRYQVVGDVIVRDGATLTIEPGTWLEFEQGLRLAIAADGRLSARGTQQAPIVFTATSEQPGWWDGVWFVGSSHPDNALEWVTIEYGGGSAHHSSVSPANLTIARSLGGNAASVAVTNSTLRHSGGFGLYLHENGAMPNSSGNTYTMNASGPVGASSNTIHYLDGGSSYAGEGADAGAPVRVSGNTVGSEVTWQALDVAYRMSGTTTVDSRLTIEPGAEFRFAGEAMLQYRADAIIRTLGTAEAPIVFTGTQAQPGWWGGIFVVGTYHPENLMEHVVIEYAGRGSFHSSVEPANLVIARSLGGNAAALTLRNSTLRHSAGVGLFVHENGALPGSESNTYTENAAGPVELSSNNAAHLDGASSFTGNGDNDYVWVNGNRIENDAMWQALDVPYGMKGTTIVYSGRHTIEAGATLAFAGQAALQYWGGSVVRVLGTADAPVRFTGTQAQAEWWQGVWVVGTEHPENLIEHAIFEYGGRSAFHSSVEAAQLTIGRSFGANAARITLRDNTYQHTGSAHGLFVHSDSQVD